MIELEHAGEGLKYGTDGVRSGLQAAQSNRTAQKPTTKKTMIRFDPHPCRTIHPSGLHRRTIRTLCRMYRQTPACSSLYPMHRQIGSRHAAQWRGPAHHVPDLAAQRPTTTRSAAAYGSKLTPAHRLRKIIQPGLTIQPELGAQLRECDALHLSPGPRDAAFSARPAVDLECIGSDRQPPISRQCPRCSYATVETIGGFQSSGPRSARAIMVRSSRTRA